MDVNARFFGEIFVTLLVIMDPPGSVPIFLSLTGAHSRSARRRSADLAVLTAFTVIVVFAVTLRFSTVILRLLGRSGVTLVTRIAGLLLSAIAVQLAADGVRDFIDA